MPTYIFFARCVELRRSALSLQLVVQRALLRQWHFWHTGRQSQRPAGYGAAGLQAGGQAIMQAAAPSWGSSSHTSDLCIHRGNLNFTLGALGCNPNPHGSVPAVQLQAIMIHWPWKVSAGTYVAVHITIGPSLLYTTCILKLWFNPERLPPKKPGLFQALQCPYRHPAVAPQQCNCPQCPYAPDSEDPFRRVQH